MSLRNRVRRAQKLIDEVTKNQGKLKREIESLKSYKYKIINDEVYKDNKETIKEINKMFKDFSKVIKGDDSIDKLNNNLRDIFKRCFKNWVSKRFITNIKIIKEHANNTYGYTSNKPNLIVNKYGFGFFPSYIDRTNYVTNTSDIINILKNYKDVKKYIFKPDKKQIYKIFMKYIPKMESVNYDEFRIPNLNIELVKLNENSSNGISKIEIHQKDTITIEYHNYYGWTLRITDSKKYDYSERTIRFKDALDDGDKLMLSQIPKESLEKLKAFITKLSKDTKQNWKYYDLMTKELEPILFGYDI